MIIYTWNKHTQTHRNQVRDILHVRITGDVNPEVMNALLESNKKSGDVEYISAPPKDEFPN